MRQERLILMSRFCADRAPGLLLTTAIAWAAPKLGWYVDGGAMSPLMWSTLLGMAYGNLFMAGSAVRPTWLVPGVAFAKARLLRLGVILYGFKLTLGQVITIGVPGLLLDAFMMVSTARCGWGFRLRSGVRTTSASA